MQLMKCRAQDLLVVAAISAVEGVEADFSWALLDVQTVFIYGGNDGKDCHYTRKNGTPHHEGPV